MLLTTAITLLRDTTYGHKGALTMGTFCPTFLSVPRLNFNTFTNNLVATVPRELVCNKIRQALLSKEFQTTAQAEEHSLIGNVLSGAVKDF